MAYHSYMAMSPNPVITPNIKIAGIYGRSSPKKFYL